MKFLPLLLTLFFISCQPETPKPVVAVVEPVSLLHGRYLMIKKGYYSELNFKTDKDVVITDNLGINAAYATTYKVFDNQVYIKTDKQDLVYDIAPDLLSPSKTGNGVLKDFIGTVAKEGSDTYTKALAEHKQASKKTIKERQGDFIAPEIHLEGPIEEDSTTTE
jgi:hypothetical protein